MAQPVIRVEGLGKQYVIGSREAAHETFREMLTGALATPFQRLRRLRGEAAQEERIWALKDVSFDVDEGEVVGIIGRNGAGKSTLLKILSRITEPTEGRAEIHGRVSSLLEVGTGFHPELTGRENIYLNGAILGMSRAEIGGKFDEIVDFAGVEPFLDTPVKRYSSGMSVRLAFAVAAHLEPEILVVDEVLAVGDAEFQRKCLGKMREVSGAGRTVLFVSHSMAMVEHLCARALVLTEGQLVYTGSVADAIGAYYRLNEDRQLGYFAIPKNVVHKHSIKPTIIRAKVFSKKQSNLGQFPTGSEMTFKVLCQVLDKPHTYSLGIGLDNNHGIRITTLVSDGAKSDTLQRENPAKRLLFICHVDNILLAPGEYRVKLSLDDAVTRQPFHKIEPAFYFEILPSDCFGVLRRPLGGVVLVRQEWKILDSSISENSLTAEPPRI